MPGFEPIGGEPIGGGPSGISPPSPPPPPPPPPIPPEPPGGYCNANDAVGEQPLGWVGDCSPDPSPPPPPVPTTPVPATVISQYANSPILLQMVENLIGYFKPEVNFENFFNQIWNIDTAVGYGLDVWGRIVGVDRVLHLSTGDFFGFEESTTAETFGHGVFYSGSDATSNFRLSDTAYRRLILAKALANITDGSIPSINQILINLFPGYGNCYVTDGHNMTMTYTFNGTLSPVDLAIVQGSGVLPKPAGVSVTVVQI